MNTQTLVALIATYLEENYGDDEDLDELKTIRNVSKNELIVTFNNNEEFSIIVSKIKGDCE